MVWAPLSNFKVWRKGQMIFGLSLRSASEIRKTYRIINLTLSTHTKYYFSLVVLKILNIPFESLLTS